MNAIKNEDLKGVVREFLGTIQHFLVWGFVVGRSRMGRRLVTT
jgi:hypothetical protein